jgi:DNA-binding CsgD family transcriptional regulator
MPTGKPVDAAFSARVQQLRAAGLTATQIAERLGLSKWAVYRAIGGAKS